jgi:3-hydroxybutyryl-CoA dehydrogenase
MSFDMTITKQDRSGIIGGGTMGLGIALNAVQHGFHVTVVEPSEGVADRFAKRMDEHAMRTTKKDRAAADQLITIWKPFITFANAVDAVANSTLVIEAIFEDIDAKARLYKSLRRILAPHAILATNTSSLLVRALASHVHDPQRFLGLHYFNPAERSPLVEVVRGEQTSNETMAAAKSFMSLTARVPLFCKDSPGFVVNRFLCPLLNEATRIHEDGVATPFQIDLVACETFGCPAGPFRTMNLVGNKVSYEATRNLSSLGGFYVPSKSLEHFGAGTTPWSVQETSPLSDAGKVRDRLLGALFLPSLELIDSGVCTSDDLDLGAKLAPKFSIPISDILKSTGETRARELVRLVTR